MISKSYAAFSAFLVALITAAGLFAIARTPPGARIAVHWGMNGTPNGWMHPTPAFLLLPGLGAALWVLLALLPRWDRRPDNLRRSETAYGATWVATTLLFAAGQGLIVGTALGAHIPVPQAVVLMVGGMFAIMGNYFGKIRPNRRFGIRTPWTLGDDAVWDRTHRLGGFVFVAAGLVLIDAALAVPQGATLVPLLIAVVVTAVLVPVVASWWFAREAPLAH